MRKGKWYNIVKRNIATGLLIGMLNSMVFADIIVDKNVQQNTSVDRAQNGSNIVNINTPNNKGISVNDFSEFRTKDPTIFNNFGSGVGRSYLAGMMASNPNLTKEQAARLILNRVGGNNRVEIENWLEVMSANKTDIIFSSKNGFYLNDTGFINFDKAIFTTSRVDLDGNGDILPFNIRGGKIDIGREGINAEGLRYLAFLSKQINIDGQVYAKDADLDVIAGEFDYNPDTREYTNQGTNNNELLISSSAYGSMYGSQIKVVANSGDIGVKGDLISYKVLKINADGTVTTNQVQGNEGIEIKAKEFTQNTSTYTEGNLKIEADKTILKGNGTQAGNILITGELDNEVNIHSKNNIELGKGLINRSGQIVAENNIRVNDKVTNKDLIYGKNNITIGKELDNTGDIQSKGDISAGSDTKNTGKVLSEGILKVNGKLESTGTIYGKDKVEVADELNNSGDLQSEGNITVGSDTTNTGRLISDKNINIQGNLNTNNTVYAKENITISENLINQKDIQAEGNMTVGKDLTNKGKILSDKELNIKGNTLNEGTLYGKENVKIEKDLTNKGNLQTGGNLKANNTLNEGKIVSEGNVELGNLDNRGELTLNKKLTTKELTNKGTGKINTGEGIYTAGKTLNHGEINTNGNFVIDGNLENYNLLNAGGLLSSKDLVNYGDLKAVEKITTRGVTFYNHGNILTTNLDVDNTNISNLNKITAIENAKLKGTGIVNHGELGGTNIELLTSTLINSNQIIADGVITAQNTNLNNIGYIGSNGKIILSGSNLSNQGKLESNIIEMYNLFAYNNNTGNINGNGVYLSTVGNLDLRGLLHGESELKISGYDIWNNEGTTGSSYIEIKGHDIVNNTELVSGLVVIEGTGSLINNELISGKNGSLSANNIINNNLIAFSEQLGIRATDKLTNNTGKAIFAGELLDINFNTLENIGGELLSQGSMSLTGNYLLNQVGTIQTTDDMELNVTKIDNIGFVEDLDKYEIYYVTWDGKEYTQDYVESGANKWDAYFTGGKHSGRGKRVDQINNQAQQSAAQGYELYLWNYFNTDIKNKISKDNSGDLKSTSTQYSGRIPLKGKLRSKATTTYANISAGGNLNINGKTGGRASELNNIDGKISASGRAEINADTIKNQTTLGNAVQLKDGHEHISYKRVKCGTANTKKCYPITYRRYFELGDTAYVTGQASIIEAGELLINTGSLILTPELDTGSQIIERNDIDRLLVRDEQVKAGKTQGTGGIVISKNIDPILEIRASGILPIDPLGAYSSLFTMTEKSTGNTVTEGEATSKYLLETRGKFVNLGDFYGSDYYLSRIGYDEGNDWNRARRLGDAYYEYLLVTRAISDKLGTRFINGLSDKELMKAMLDNSVDLQKDLQLSVGVALTPDQVKALKSDVIWYEYEIVNGENVLVPKVYLSQTTLATIETDGRDRIGGLTLTAITADELRNNGQLIGNGGVTYVNAGRVYNVTDTNQLSEIRGNQISITATSGNIENIGGKIKGIESVTLSAENGDIINSSSTRIVRYNRGDLDRTEHDEILSVGSIESEGTTYIEGRNYISEAGKVSGKTTVIDAKENITIGSLTLKGDDKFGSDSDNYEIYQSTRKIGSEVTGTENVVLNAGNDLNIKGSKVATDGLAQLTAGNNINILSEKESEYKERKEKSGNSLSNYSLEEKSYQEYASGSTVIGTNVIMEASNDINVKASTIAALKDEEGQRGNLSAKAGNNINILAETLDNSYTRKEKSSGFSTSLTSSGGNFGAGVSYNQNSMEQQRNGTTVATSTLISEGSTILDAGNKIRTEAMQANIGENLVIKGTNGVELLDAQEVYNETIKQKSSSIGVNVSVGFTPAQLANTASDVSKNMKDYGFGDTSQTINTLGNGLQDLRNVSGLTQNIRNWYGGNGYISTKDIIQNGNIAPDNLRNAAKGMVSASVSASYSQSSYESNTSGTNSVAGNINVGKNFILQSENGDVTLVNQKINVGENFVVDANNFTVKAGENTYKNDTKSSSTGANIGYDIVNNQVMGGANVSGGKSNASSKTYDNSIINVGGTFQLTTKEDALFAGVNVNADKINFDIGRDLSIISLQDEYKSDGKNWGVGLNVSGKIPGTEKQGGYARPTGSVNYGENHQDSKWTGNQTTILAENGGNIKVGETLTNIGSIIGSLSDSNKLSIEANKVVVENLKDHNEGSNFGLSMGGIGLGTKDQGNTTPVGQTGVQYGSHDKQQDSNATFVNTEVTEAGKKLNLEEMGINTDINKAQVVTKDEVVEQIDTVLHTDLLNKSTRDQVIKDINGLINTPGDIIKAIQIANNNEDSNFLDNLVGTIRSTDSDMNNTLTMEKKYKELNARTDLSADEKAAQALILANQSANAQRENFGIDKDIPILVLFADDSKGDEVGAFLREDGMMVIFLDPSKIDMSDQKQVYNGLMYEMNHYNPSNPYVYDKKEGEVNKGTTLHDQEEGFTSIGRKEITGEGNKFYDEVLKGSSVVSAGNDIYGELDIDDFDYWGEGLYEKAKNKCNGNRWCKAGKEKVVKPAINMTGKVVVNTVDSTVKLTTGGNKQLKSDLVNAVNKPNGTTNIIKNVVTGNSNTLSNAKNIVKNPVEDTKNAKVKKVKDEDRQQKQPTKPQGDNVLYIEEKQNSELGIKYPYDEIKENANIDFGNASTIRNFGEDKGLSFGNDALAVEPSNGGFIIYVDKKNYDEATKIYETNYNTNVVVKLKEDMTSKQKTTYAVENDGSGIKSGVEGILSIFNKFGSQTANPCQYNCEGKSYVYVNTDVSNVLEGLIGNKNLEGKLGTDFSQLSPNQTSKTGESKVVTDEYGNTYKVKDGKDSGSNVLEDSKNKGNSSGTSNNNSNLNNKILKPVKTGTKMDSTIEKVSENSKINEILNNSKITTTNKKVDKLTNFDSNTKGIDNAIKDFNDMGLKNVKEITISNGSKGYVGILEDGSTVVVRNYSKSAGPTIEIISGNKTIKIRY